MFREELWKGGIVLGWSGSIQGLGGMYSVDKWGMCRMYAGIYTVCIPVGHFYVMVARIDPWLVDAKTLESLVALIQFTVEVKCPLMQI